MPLESGHRLRVAPQDPPDLGQSETEVAQQQDPLQRHERGSVVVAVAVRADPARRQNIPGAGLGRTIAREIIQRAGGKIAIVNRPKGGLTQIVELPTVAAAA